MHIYILPAQKFGRSQAEAGGRRLMGFVPPTFFAKGGICMHRAEAEKRLLFINLQLDSFVPSTSLGSLQLSIRLPTPRHGAWGHKLGGREPHGIFT